MGEPTYKNEYGRLTNLINGLENQRREESAEKKKLQKVLERLKSPTV